MQNCNFSIGESYCFHAHPRILYLSEKISYLNELQLVSNESVSVYQSLGKTMFHSKSYRTIFETYAYLAWPGYEEQGYAVNILYAGKYRLKTRIKNELYIIKFWTNQF